jgi:hypothetical protein
MQKYDSSGVTKRRKNLWFERAMAIAAVTNLAWVTFDLTYVSWRNFWLQGRVPIPLTQQKIQLPMPTMDCRDRSVEKNQPPSTRPQSLITCLYDPIKGIEPHRETQAYLNAVQQLKNELAQTGIEPGLKSPPGQAALANLRALSTELIAANPFEAAGKSGTLEKIKNEMRGHVSDRIGNRRSPTEAFNIFWSTNHPTAANYLTASSWAGELAWFETTIQPLIETNYFRTISENGDPTNNFWLLDAPFVTLFFLEFLARTFYLSRRYSSLTWLDAIIWRWYDIPLFIPFSLSLPFLALSRVVPTLLRLHQAQLIDLHDLNARARQSFVAAIAEEMTEMVVVQVVNQVQNSIKRGEVSDWLQRTTTRRYVDINNVNEIEAIAKQITHLAVYTVFPKIQPDLEALLRQSIQSVLSQSPAYRTLQAIPGIGGIPAQVSDRIVADLTQTAYNSFKATLEDPKMTELTTKLVQTLSTTILTEARNSNFQDMQLLLADLLEEIKINYIQRLSEEDTTLILDQTRHLQQVGKQRGHSKGFSP